MMCVSSQLGGWLLHLFLFICTHTQYWRLFLVSLSVLTWRTSSNQPLLNVITATFESKDTRLFSLFTPKEVVSRTNIRSQRWCIVPTYKCIVQWMCNGCDLSGERSVLVWPRCRWTSNHRDGKRVTGEGEESDRRLSMVHWEGLGCKLTPIRCWLMLHTAY